MDIETLTREAWMQLRNGAKDLFADALLQIDLDFELFVYVDYDEYFSDPWAYLLYIQGTEKNNHCYTPLENQTTEISFDALQLAISEILTDFKTWRSE
jgi:hypothetical protein